MQEFHTEQHGTVHERLTGSRYHWRPLRYRGEKRTDGVEVHFLSAMVDSLTPKQAEETKGEPTEATRERVRRIIASVRRHKQRVAAARAYDDLQPSPLANEAEVKYGSKCQECDTYGETEVSGFHVCVNCGRLRL